MSGPFEVESDDEDLVDDHEGDHGEAQPVPPRFNDVGEWVEQWFVQVIAGPYSRNESAGSRTWCPLWWKHKAVVIPLSALHRAWEAARASEDDSAMSAWWVQHAHSHVRWLCDATAGPMYRCSPDHHEGRHFPDESLHTIPAPPGWFTQVDQGDEHE